VNVYPFIEAENAGDHNVKRACELLQVSRAAYYAQRTDRPSARQREDAELAEQIKDLHTESKGRYGAPRIHAELARKGRRHGKKRVARLMRQANLRGRTAKRWKKTTIPDPAAAARADLIRRDFTADAASINTRWCGDITYVPTWEGWLYLATVIDISSRRAVGYAIADHLRTDLIADALTNAVAARNPDAGVIFHSDRGRPIHLHPVRRPGPRLRRQALGGSHRSMLGQRPGRIVLRLAQGRVPRPAALAHPGSGPTRHRRIHRLVQRHPTPLRTGLQDTQRVRARHRTRGHRADSLTEPSTLSVKAG
jgi:HTH-like domain/Integrase core domain